MFRKAFSLDMITYPIRRALPYANMRKAFSLLCEHALVKFSVLNDNSQLVATKYKLYIPSEEELKREIAHIRSLMQGGTV